MYLKKKTYIINGIQIDIMIEQKFKNKIIDVSNSTLEFPQHMNSVNIPFQLYISFDLT